MDISSKTVTTKVHSGRFSADDIKHVAVSAVRKHLGLVDDSSIVSSDANVAADSSVTVEIVEAVRDETGKAQDQAPKQDAPVAPAEQATQPVMPLTGLSIPTLPAA